MRPVTSFSITIFIISFSSITTLKAQVKIDYSAVPVFWEIADTLSTDKDPSSGLWEQFAHHPAYAQIEKSGNRVSYLKKVLPIVFKPSHTEKLKRIIEGEESLMQYFASHLQAIKVNRAALDTYLRSNELDVYKQSFVRALDYLPNDIEQNEINLTIYIALFEDNGFGGKVITMDLLHLMNGTHQENMDFFGHEFHHALRGQSKRHHLFETKDTIYDPIIEALNKLPLEGVASRIDKSKYFDQAYLSNIPSLSIEQQETVAEFQDLVENANKNLEQIDRILSGDLTMEEKGRQIFNNMPWSGHSVGFYMSRSIENKFGKEQLIEVQYSCIDFILAYQKASQGEDTLYTFSDKAIAFLQSIK